MIARVVMALATAGVAAPGLAFAHPGAVSHVHPHAAPALVACILLLAAASLVWRRRSA